MENMYSRLDKLYNKLAYIEKNQLYTSQIGWAYYSNITLNKLWVFKTCLGPRLIFINKVNNLIILKYLINRNIDYNSIIFEIQADTDNYKVITSLIEEKDIDLALYEIEIICGLN